MCSSQKECPICMDDIMEINYVITECGHTFHTSCLMKNAAHNGFGCPYCRAVMAEVPEEEEEEESEEDDDETTVVEEWNETPFSNYSLRGMRWLFQRSNNEEIEEENDVDEEEEEDELPIPSSDLVAQKLLEQEITMNDLVKCLLAINHEEYEEKEEYQTKEDEIFEKIQIIISNYRNPVQGPIQGPIQGPDQGPIQVQEQVQEQDQVPDQVQEQVPEQALAPDQEQIRLFYQQRRPTLHLKHFVEREIEIITQERFDYEIDFSAQPKEKKIVKEEDNRILVF